MVVQVKHWSVATLYSLPPIQEFHSIRVLEASVCFFVIFYYFSLYFILLAIKYTRIANKNNEQETALRVVQIEQHNWIQLTKTRRWYTCKQGTLLA